MLLSLHLSIGTSSRCSLQPREHSWAKHQQPSLRVCEKRSLTWLPLWPGGSLGFTWDEGDGHDHRPKKVAGETKTQGVGG